MKSKKTVPILVIPVAAVLLALLVGFQAGVPREMRRLLTSHLTHADRLPDERTFDAVYILGGGQQSLEDKYRMLAALYGENRCEHIMILSRRGTTEYSPDLGRNLTHDEWSLMRLAKLGVPRQAVQPVEVERGIFGTLSEARRIAEKAQQERWKNILLITSPHHTRRTRASFSCLLNGSANIWVIASRHEAGLPELVSEFLKMKIYQFWLLETCGG